MRHAQLRYATAENLSDKAAFLRMRSRAELLSAHGGEPPSVFDFEELKIWRRGGVRILDFRIETDWVCAVRPEAGPRFVVHWQKIRA